MAVKDIRSNLLVTRGDVSLVAVADTTVQGVSEIDTANYELGLMLASRIINPGDADMTIGFADSDTQGGPYTNITNTDQLIGDGLIANGTPITVAGDNEITIGLISNKRYVVPTLTGASGLTTGEVNFTFTQKGELLPDDSLV
jgi:hypothetical protein